MVVMCLILSIVRANCLISFWTAFWTLWRDHWNIWYKYHNKHIFSEQIEQNLFPSMILQTVPKYLTLHLDSGEFFSSVINTKLYWESHIQFWLGFFPFLPENMAIYFSFCRNKYSKYGISTSVLISKDATRLNLSSFFFAKKSYFIF